MPDRLVCNSSMISAHLGRRRAGAVEPMLPALVRGVIFISTLAVPFVAALLAG
ncbi:hypothetical protein NLM33_06935 [Bradyrhizobium sp. CCGUVB1N3]|uniref:hypothetical protein n=1 Tax=Bradyrhizobium sp. CCGUVB1N3 TaxID=2949629 RepID=UPI0020B225EC|nr:hypothetical protein [Bradyrhizobium sp. CCGUVB1N3]MCP3470061.1 hypothetical protein [Bradyrhizobium sp. CCGUVB1N3]